MEASVCRYFQMLMSGVISCPTDAAANTSANALVNTPLVLQSKFFFFQLGVRRLHKKQQKSDS